MGAGTNPCVMLIKEKIVSGDIIKYPETWAWIISNTMRTIRTPTKELIGELVELLKTEHIERNRIIRAAYVMGLTELIHKACVNPLTIKNEFPYRIYGQMCYKDMPVIKETLIPYLSQKLSESSRTDNNTVITFTTALGNIGTEESTEELLKVIEGKIPTPTYPRAIAVYMLIKPALIKPSIYKPIFLSIIENPAEHSDVKQHAIFGLVSSYPSSTDLQRLALRTWFEPSRQTVSLIYSTLKSLTQLSGSNPEYERLRIKAQLILPMAKPVTEGYQYSRNYHYTSFVESLRTLVSHRLTWTSTEQSFIPTTFYNKMQLKSSIGALNSIETILHMEGMETVVSKLIEMYSELVTPEEQESSVSKIETETKEKLRTLGVHGKKKTKPEAHLTLKYMGLQKLYSVNEEIVQTIVDKTSEIIDNGELERGLRTEFFKILDLHRSNYIMPTESGMPVYLTLKTPTATQMKGEIKLSGKHTEQPGGEFSTVVVSNIKKLLHSGVKSELTKRFYGVGVETSMHVAVPVKGEVSYRKGQVQVTLKQTKETGFQREHSVLEFDVHTFTTSQSLSDFEVMSKGRNVKTIRTRESELKKEVNVGKPIGLDLKLKLETEEIPLNTYSTLEYLRMDGVSGSILSLINTIKRTKLQLLFSPSTSETKELDLHLNVGYGLMKNQQKQATIRILDEEVKERIERACQEFAPESVEKCKSEMYEWEKKQDSEVVQFCKEEKKWCIEKEEKDGLSRVESTRSCEKKLLFCTMKSQSRSILKTAIGKIETGSAVSVSLAAILRSSERSQDKKIETHIALSQKNSSLSETETHVTGRVTIETPMLRKPYHVEIEANTILKKPTSMWNREELMREDLTSRLMFIGQYGLRGEEKKTIKSTLRVLKSDEHKKYIRQSPEYEQCIKDESEGRLLSESCEELRTLVTSLDKI